MEDGSILNAELSNDSLSVSLRDGRVISVPLVWYPRLLNATPAQRKNWKIAGGGYGIHWPDVDEDLSTEGLLRGAPSPKTLVEAARLGLSEREKVVLRLIAQGSTNKEIARQLSISPETVRAHLHRLFRKLGLPNRTATKDLLVHGSISSSGAKPSGR